MDDNTVQLIIRLRESQLVAITNAIKLGVAARRTLLLDAADDYAEELEQSRWIEEYEIARLAILNAWQEAINNPERADELGKEKKRRIYYQNIVYSVCNQLDQFNERITVCGTVDEPSDEVQLGVAGLLYAHKLLRNERNAFCDLIERQSTDGR